MAVSAIPASIAPLPTFPTTSDLVLSLQNAVQSLNGLITNFNQGGVTETYIEAAAVLMGSDASTVTQQRITGGYELLTMVQLAEFILTATGTALDYKAADVGVYRKQAVAAATSLCLQFTSQSGPVGSPVVISVGSIVAAQVADPTVAPVLYRTTTVATIGTGNTVSTLANVECVTTGSIGNQGIGAINLVVSGATGLSVSNIIPIGGGADQEQDDYPNGGLRYRALQAIPNASQCTVLAIKNAAISYPGIISASVKDLTDNDGVTFIRGKAQVYCDDGSGNLSAFATTTASCVMPAVGSSVTVATDGGSVNFPENSSCLITDGTNGFNGLVTSSGGTSPLTILNLAVVSGTVGNTINSGAEITNPNNAALNAFNADLTAGLWRAAGTQVFAHGSTVVPMTISFAIDVNEEYAATVESEATVTANAAQDTFAYVNQLLVGGPLILAAIIEVVKAISGVSNIPASSILINGVNADFGVNGMGEITLDPAQTLRCGSVASVTVTPSLVPY